MQQPEHKGHTLPCFLPMPVAPALLFNGNGND